MKSQSGDLELPPLKIPNQSTLKVVAEFENGLRVFCALTFSLYLRTLPVFLEGVSEVFRVVA